MTLMKGKVMAPLDLGQIWTTVYVLGNKLGCITNFLQCNIDPQNVCKMDFKQITTWDITMHQ